MYIEVRREILQNHTGANVMFKVIKACSKSQVYRNPNIMLVRVIESRNT